MVLPVAEVIMAKPICVYVIFDNAGEPIAAGILRKGEKHLFNLYGKGSDTTLQEVEDNKAAIAAIINNAVANNIPIITSDFKRILNAFPIEIAQRIDYSVYDLCWETDCGTKDCKAARAIIDKVLDRLGTTKYRDWQRIYANAAVVYQALENRGVTIGLIHHKPLWAQNTYSGRSKNLQVNIQGQDGNEFLANPSGEDGDVFIYFDWMAADIRVAAALSGDELLNESFKTSDPYTHLEQLLTDDFGTISRSECKLQLLQAINSFNFSHPILESVYRQLGVWLRESKRKLDEFGELKSILGRKFQVAKARNQNPLAVQNGVLQGSVAHAMQLTVKRVWDTYGSSLLCEIHDSIAMTSKPEYVPSMIRGVVDMMTRPFRGVLDSDPFFPVKVSIGKKFRKWKPIRIYRETGVESIKNERTNKTAEAGEEAAGETPVGDTIQQADDGA